MKSGERVQFCDQSSLAKIQEAPIGTINFKIKK